MDPAQFNGTSERQADSTHKVVWWNVVGGDYMNARCKTAYFPSAEEARSFADPYDAPPELAQVIAL